MTVIVVPGPMLEQAVADLKKLVVHEEDMKSMGSLQLEGGFVVPESKAFGHSFRDYDKETERSASVEEFYRINHINQTYNFAIQKKEEYGKFNRAEMSIWEYCELLNEFVDESDPGLDEPQIEHLLQTAEAIRKAYSDQDWLHLPALIHGYTYPLGCAFDPSIVHHQVFKENEDDKNPLYSTKLGIYSENCGLDKITMSWGHAMHRSGAYESLMNKEDKEMLKCLQIINKYDLYSKSMVRIEKVRPCYQSLIDKYFPANLRW